MLRRPHPAVLVVVFVVWIVGCVFFLVSVGRTTGAALGLLTVAAYMSLSALIFRHPDERPATLARALQAPAWTLLLVGYLLLGWPPVGIVLAGMGALVLLVALGSWIARLTGFSTEGLLQESFVELGQPIPGALRRD